MQYACETHQLMVKIDENELQQEIEAYVPDTNPPEGWRPEDGLTHEESHAAIARIVLKNKWLSVNRKRKRRGQPLFHGPVVPELDILTKKLLRYEEWRRTQPEEEEEDYCEPQGNGLQDNESICLEDETCCEEADEAEAKAQKIRDA